MLFDIQFLADEAAVDTAETVNTGAGEAPDAGENADDGKDDASCDKGREFEKLINGEYKEEYSKRVSEVVKKRLKNAKETIKKLSSNEAPQVIQPIDEEGEIEDIANQSHGEKESDNKPEIDEKTVEEIGLGLAEVKAAYPNFSLKRELDNPQFCRLLSVPGIDFKGAFEACHHDEIVHGAMQYAVREAERKIAYSTALGMKRPNEAVQDKHSCSGIDNDPRGLTKAQRADIKKRVRRGEKIIW